MATLTFDRERLAADEGMPIGIARIGGIGAVCRVIHRDRFVLVVCRLDHDIKGLRILAAGLIRADLGPLCLDIHLVGFGLDI